MHLAGPDKIARIEEEGILVDMAFINDTHHSHTLTILASKIRRRIATDIDFRLFFVLIRENIASKSTFRMLLNASAHSNALDGEKGGSRTLLSNMFSVLYVNEILNKKIPSDQIPHKTAMYIRNRLQEDRRSEFDATYRRTKKGHWVLNKGRDVPHHIFREAFYVDLDAKIRVESLESIANMIDRALADSRIPVRLDLASNKELMSDVSVALVATLCGLEFEAPWCGESFFDLSIHNHEAVIIAVMRSENSGYVIKTPVAHIGDIKGKIDYSIINISSKLLGIKRRTPCLILSRKEDGSVYLEPSWAHSQEAMLLANFDTDRAGFIVYKDGDEEFVLDLFEGGSNWID